jgi:hypothetical protein
MNRFSPARGRRETALSSFNRNRTMTDTRDNTRDITRDITRVNTRDINYNITRDKYQEFLAQKRELESISQVAGICPIQFEKKKCSGLIKLLVHLCMISSSIPFLF